MAPFTYDELEPTLRPLLEASLLPPRAYTDHDVADWEAENLFLGGWVCVAHASRLRERGAYVTRTLAGESLLFVAGDDGVARGFHNVCRHRGARLVDSQEGTMRRLQCPYHAWSYRFDGSLGNAPFTERLENFDPGCHSLTPIRTETFAGLVFCDLSGAAPALEEHLGDAADQLARYRNAELGRAASIDYDVSANWKAIVDNYSECLHCPGVHPELSRLTHFTSGDEHYGPGAWCGGTMQLYEHAATMGANGGLLSRPPIQGIEGSALREVVYYAIFPNALVSLHPDYVMLHTLWPDGPGRTTLTCEWFFEPETMERPGFDASDAVEFWDLVNRQDWQVCELAQKGVGSRGYRRGRFTSAEITVHQFAQMVARAYLQERNVSFRREAAEVP